MPPLLMLLALMLLALALMLPGTAREHVSRWALAPRDGFAALASVASVAGGNLPAQFAPSRASPAALAAERVWSGGIPRADQVAKAGRTRWIGLLALSVAASWLASG